MSKLPNAITAVLESSINRYLALDPAAGDLLNSLENKSITVILKEFSFPVHFSIQQQQIYVHSNLDEQADVSLRASIPQLINMTLANNDTDSILGSDIEMSGNMDVGRQFRDVFKNLDIDWEEILSRYTGDIIAHKVGTGFRHLNKWMSNTGQSIQQDITEYLQEESQQLPTGSEITAFIKQVDDVRLSIDRVEARIKLLRNALEKQQ